MKLKQTRQVKKWGERGLASSFVCDVCCCFAISFCDGISLDSSVRFSIFAGFNCLCVFFCAFVVDLCHTCVCVCHETLACLVFSWIKGMLRT